MRALIVFVSILAISPCLSRPQSSDYANENPNEVEEDENEPDDSLTDEEESRLNDQKPAVEPRRQLLRDDKAAAQDQYSLAEIDNFADYKENAKLEESRLPRKIFSFKKQNDKPAGPKTPLSSPANNRPCDEYTNTRTNVNADVPMDSQFSYNRDMPNINAPQDLSKVILDKRTIHFQSSREERDPYEEKSRETNINKNGYINDEAMDKSEQERYLKQFYNTMQAENSGGLEDKSPGRPHFDSRDRRDVKSADKEENFNVGSKDNSDKNINEDDETAIRRHIKRLSNDELEQLLNSLTDDKRELLKKIISDSIIVDAGSINKREITKKAGAVEENNLVENGQSELNKVQGDSISAETYSGTSMSSSTESTETSKKAESFDVSSSKPDMSKMENNDNSDDKSSKQFDNVVFSANTESKVADVPKKEGKREISYEENMNYNDNEEQGDIFSQFEDTEGEMQHEDSGIRKREASIDDQSGISDSMKSLKESFPNSNAYEDSVPYSGPLVRVKRNHLDKNNKKRSAALFPATKVGYYAYKAENEDEDSEEGNEFDDEGFYDRNANFANNQDGPEEVEEKSRSFTQPKRSAAYDPKSSIQNLDSDTMSIGSDTDSVLSGAEGVDDNLMYSSGTRNRRSADRNTVDNDPAELTAAVEKIKSSDGNSFNCPHYQEIDAFGPLSRNYDVETGRYKRIRQATQSHNIGD